VCAGDRFVALGVLAVALLLGSCGGGSGGSAPRTPSSPSVVLSTVTGTTNLEPGQSRQFSAMAGYSNGNNVGCTSSATWQSSNTSVATVSTTGMVTAVAPGVADIRATYEGVSGAARVTVGTPGS